MHPHRVELAVTAWTATVAVAIVVLADLIANERASGCTTDRA
jgi:hypothetical protein